MSIKELHKRYLDLNKKTFSCLKGKGFTKKGKKYFKEKGDLILELISAVPRPSFNSEECYRFELGYLVCTTNPDYLEAYRLLFDSKAKIGIIIAKNFAKYVDENFYFSLKVNDPPNKDENLINCFQKEILEDTLPWFDTVSSLADITKIAEEELKLDRKDREFFGGINIKLSLLILYIAQGLKEKAYGLFDQYVEGVPQTARSLAEKDVKKIIKYFEDKEKK